MCNFIMIMILLVTAYNGLVEQGDGQDNDNSYSHGYTHGYSKYFRQARVRTAFRWRPCRPSRLALVVGASSGSRSRHAPSEAAGDHLWNNRIV